MGWTGEGKTTLLDAFVNYLIGIEHEDGFRYKLTNENINNLKTEEINTYFINISRDNEDKKKEIFIRKIDTPGFGDIKKDDNIKKYKSLFKEIAELDYIVVTNKSSNTHFNVYY